MHLKKTKNFAIANRSRFNNMTGKNAIRTSRIVIPIISTDYWLRVLTSKAMEYPQRTLYNAYIPWTTIS